jgi:HSP20 family protein
MTIWRWGAPVINRGNFPEVNRLQQEMDRLWNTVAGSGTGLEHARVFPPINISEDENQVLVRAELPGIESDQIELSLTGERLILRGERRTALSGEKINYHRKEREDGVFRRIINLPGRVDSQQVEALFKNGVLTIKIAKAEEVKPRQVSIQVA